MSDAVGTIALSAAFLAGISGSAHCLVMCGGLSGALSMRSRPFTHSPRGVWREAWLYHAGRLGGYAMAGAIFGLFGASLQSLVDLPMLATIARVAAGTLVILVAVRLLLWFQCPVQDPAPGRAFLEARTTARKACRRQPQPRTRPAARITLGLVTVRIGVLGAAAGGVERERTTRRWRHAGIRCRDVASNAAW